MEEVESSWGSKLSLIRQKFTEKSTGHEGCLLAVSRLRKPGVWFMALGCWCAAITLLCQVGGVGGATALSLLVLHNVVQYPTAAC